MIPNRSRVRSAQRLDRRRERGQTTIDFTIGIGIFLVAIMFVTAFVPSMLQPFDQNVQEDTGAADRIATKLGTGVLSHPSRPYLLDRECTLEFFRVTPDGEPPDCPFDQNTNLADSDVVLADRVGVTDRIRLHVRVVDDMNGDDTANTLCWNGAAVDEEGTGDCGAGALSFSIGEEPPADAGSVVTARRVVSIERNDAQMIVRVW